MSDPNTFDPDLSPSLGGDRARPEPPPADEPAAQDTPFEIPGGAAFRNELEDLFGAEGAEVLEALTQIGTIGAGLSTIFGATLQAIESQLPQAIAAFEDLVDAVGQAVDQALEPRQDENDRS